jgi:hypothetical protein
LCLAYAHGSRAGYIRVAAATNLSGAVRLLLSQLKLELDQLVTRLEEADTLIKKIAPHYRVV